MNNRFWAVIGVIFLVFIGIMWSSSQKDTSKTGSNDKAGKPTEHIKGNTSSKVTLVEYGDFQCPTCGAYYPIIAQVLAKYEDKISFQFRHLPLTQIHQHAFAASRAAEAASKQGKFWEMYDLIYQNQQSWSSAPQPTEAFTQFATQIGLDINKYQTDFKSAETNRVINNDIAAFKKTGNSLGTPTFFLNGKKIDLKQLANGNTPSADSFSKLIDQELKKQGQ